MWPILKLLGHYLEITWTLGYPKKTFCAQVINELVQELKQDAN